jgi:hypothetical protein
MFNSMTILKLWIDTRWVDFMQQKRSEALSTHKTFINTVIYRFGSKCLPGHVDPQNLAMVTLHQNAPFFRQSVDVYQQQWISGRFICNPASDILITTTTLYQV